MFNLWKRRCEKCKHEFIDVEGIDTESKPSCPNCGKYLPEIISCKTIYDDYARFNQSISIKVLHAYIHHDLATHKEQWGITHD